MKHLSKALVALSFLGLASAAHAQSNANSYFGTTFDTITTYPFTDGTPYQTTTPTTNPGELSGQGGFTATQAGFAEAFAIGGTASGGTASGTGALLQSDLNGGAANVTGGVSVAHSLNKSVVGGFNFAVDFQLSGTGSAAPDNSFAFNFLTGGTNIFSVNFAPGGTNNTAIPQLVIGGTVVSQAVSGPTLAGGFFHLSITVTSGGAITATLGGGGTQLNAAAGSVTPTGISSFSVSEVTNTAAGTGNDYIEFDNISAVIPEPSTYAMMGLGLVGMLGLMKFRRIKA